MSAQDWTIVAHMHDKLGESAMWRPSEQAIYWVDWYGPTLHRLIPNGRVESWIIPGASSLGSSTFASNGRLLLAVDTGIKIFDPTSGALDDFADPNAGREGVSYNDSKLDRQGRLWVGTYDIRESEPRGILYCVDTRRNVTAADSGYTVCNGPAFSPDGRVLYFSDTVGKRIMAYDVEPGSPRLANRRLFADLSDSKGMPDGLTVDGAGFVWCALYGAGQVLRFDANGQLHQTLTLPTPNITSCAFGGAAMTTLFVTSGHPPADMADEFGGALFAFETDVIGVAEGEFSIDGD